MKRLQTQVPRHLQLLEKQCKTCWWDKQLFNIAKSKDAVIGFGRGDNRVELENQDVLLLLCQSKNIFQITLCLGAQKEVKQEVLSQPNTGAVFEDQGDCVHLGNKFKQFVAETALSYHKYNNI